MPIAASGSRSCSRPLPDPRSPSYPACRVQLTRRRRCVARCPECAKDQPGAENKSSMKVCEDCGACDKLSHPPLRARMTHAHTHAHHESPIEGENLDRTRLCAVLAHLVAAKVSSLKNKKRIIGCLKILRRCPHNRVRTGLKRPHFGLPVTAQQRNARPQPTAFRCRAAV